MPIVKSGKLRPIAVTTLQRVPALPNVPTVDESGVKGYDVTNWHGFIGPKGLPRPIVDRVNGEVTKIIKQKDMEEKLQADGVSPAGGPPEQFLKIISREIEQWKKVAAQAKIKLE
jgi:tripartite-type tricarboxylate transporter receptor subunit TctC